MAVFFLTLEKPCFVVWGVFGKGGLSAPWWARSPVFVFFFFFFFFSSVCLIVAIYLVRKSPAPGRSPFAKNFRLRPCCGRRGSRRVPGRRRAVIAAVRLFWDLILVTPPSHTDTTSGLAGLFYSIICALKVGGCVGSTPEVPY